MAHVDHEIVQLLTSERARRAVSLVDDHLDIAVGAVAQDQDDSAVRLVAMIGRHHGHEAVAGVGEIDPIADQGSPQQLLEKRGRGRDVHPNPFRHDGTLSRAPIPARPPNR